ncbi:hypothetical protein [Noviherbaspirillum sp.]|uniref:hypothetical protein n=1 Tax=Noviherbaspirillum sp. TaxID=1926288 RepID=UPI0025DF9905|nr:hypothetical protein [Noviherbaspirillum sp.]
MLWQSAHSELMAMPKYDRIAIYVFRQLAKGHTEATLPNDLVFNQGDVVAAMKAAVDDGVIDKDVRNVPDVKYTYDARREFPAEIEQLGPRTWLQCGKGKYVLKKTRRKNIIDLPGSLDRVPPTQAAVDQTPQFIADLLGTDEQATFTRVRNASVMFSVLGFQISPLQGHHRTSVSYGQIEIDEVHAGIDQNGVVTIVPISGKGGQDKLSWSQALNLNTYAAKLAAEKAPQMKLAWRSLGLWRDNQNTIWIVEFTPETDIDMIEIATVKRFKFQSSALQRQAELVAI